MTATYRNEQHAAIRAVSVDAISTCKPAAWQTARRSGFVAGVAGKGGADGGGVK